MVPFKSLRSRLALMVLLAVLPAMAVLLVTLRWERDALRDAAAVSAEHAARVAATSHGHAIEETHGLLLALSRLPVIAARDGAACSALLAQVHASQGRFANLGAVDPDGNVFCSAVPAALPTPLSDRRWFTRTVASGDFSVGPFERGQFAGGQVFRVGHPVQDVDGRLVAVVYASVDLAELSAQAAEDVAIEGATVTLQDGTGRVLAHWPDAERWVGRTVADRPTFADMRARGTGRIVGVGLDGTASVFGFTALDEHVAPPGAVLSVGIPLEVAYARATRNLEVGLLALATMSVLAFGLSWMGSQLLVVRPLRRLTEASARLRGGDLAARSQLRHGPDELGRLAHVFDEMAASVDALTRHNRLILESTGEGILALDPDGRVRSANPAAVAMLGVPAGEIVGACGHLLVHGQASGHTREACPLHLSGRPVPRGDAFLRADGTELPVQVVSSAIRDGQHVTGTVVFFTDMRERRRLEDQLRQAAKMEAVGKLAGGVAHDFNNLLTAILGYGDLLRLRLGPRSPVQREVGEVLNAAQRAAALTRQLLAFSRRQALAPRVVDLNAVVRGLEKMLRRLIGEDVTLVLDLDPLAGNILADQGQIEQVLMNLAVNARDAMPHGGTLTFRTRRVTEDEPGERTLAMGPGVALEVIDTGVGMDADVEARIFEPFFTTKETGTGLGLSMVYGIVKQSRGEVVVDSAPGLGTVFRIWLPRTEQALAAQSESVGRAPMRGDETVLVVEDDAAVRTLVRRTLEDAGYVVLEATDGAHARDLCGAYRGSIHLLVTDVIMPGISGRELAVLLEVRRPGMRVLYMSGYTDGELVARGLEGGAFLAKPFAPPDLLAHVREALDGRPESPAAAAGM